MAEVQRTEVDGVPTYWIERPGPLMATLIFRVGQADETLPTRGVSHLVEHLGLFPLTQASCEYNGATEDSFTSFYATGTPDEVTDFLNRIAAAIAALPLDRMEMEKQVIKTEDASRGSSFVADMLQRRFGPAGHGLLAYDEFGMRTLTPDFVATWAAQNFGSANAVLAMTGPPPPGLRLALPPGAGRRPLAASLPVAQEYPTITVHNHQVLGASFIAPRSTALTSLMRIIQRRAMEHLRTELGVSYSITTDYRRLDGQQAHLTIAADTLPEVASKATEGLLNVLLSLARTGPTVPELDSDFAEAQKAFGQDDALLGDLIRAARYDLIGEEPQSRARLLREQREVTPDVHAALLDEALNSSFWLVPSGTAGANWRFRPYIAWSPKAVLQAKLFLPLQGTDIPAGATLHASRDGVSYTIAADKRVTVFFQECAGALIWNNGDRVLYGNDGFVLLIEPRKWEGGHNLLQLVDHELRPEIRILMGDRQLPGGTAEPPAQPVAAGAAMHAPPGPTVGMTASSGPAMPAMATGAWPQPVARPQAVPHRRFKRRRTRSVYAFLIVSVLAWTAVAYAASLLDKPLAAGETKDERIGLLVVLVFCALVASVSSIRRIF